MDAVRNNFYLVDSRIINSVFSSICRSGVVGFEIFSSKMEQDCWPDPEVPQAVRRKARERL